MWSSEPIFVILSGTIIDMCKVLVGTHLTAQAKLSKRLLNIPDLTPACNFTRFAA